MMNDFRELVMGWDKGGLVRGFFLVGKGEGGGNGRSLFFFKKNYCFTGHKSISPTVGI